MQRNTWRIVGLFLLVMILGVGCASAPSSKPGAQAPSASMTAKTPEVAKIGAAAMGGGYFLAGGGISAVLKKDNIQSVVVDIGGGRNNAIKASDGEIDIGFTNTVEACEEWEKNNHRNQRSLFPLFSGPVHFVVNGNLPIKTVYDLKDYSISLATAASTHNIAGRAILEILGIKPKQIQNISLEDSANLIRDGQLAGLFVASTAPIPVVSELKATNNIKIIAPSEEDMDKVITANPAFSKAVIPANTYKDQPEDLRTLTSWNIAVTNKDMSDEWVYRVMDLVFKNKEELVATMAGLKELDTKYVGSLAIVMHKAAVKWYKDNGIDVPAALLPPEYEK